MVYIIEKKETRVQKSSLVPIHKAENREPVRINKNTKEDVKIGHSINIECTADVKTKIEWFREDERLVDDEELGVIITDSIRIEKDKKLKTSLLTVEDVEESDSGLYWCKNSANPRDSDRIRINVVRAVKVEPALWKTEKKVIEATVQPQPATASVPGYEGGNSQTLREGERINLKAIVSGASPKAKLRWYRGDEEITDDELSGVHISERHDIKKNIKCSFLTISPAKQCHSDVYTCINSDNESVVLLAIVKVKGKQ